MVKLESLQTVKYPIGHASSAGDLLTYAHSLWTLVKLLRLLRYTGTYRTRKDVYLRISVLRQSTRAIIKSRDGVNTPEANNSSSQCMPV